MCPQSYKWESIKKPITNIIPNGEILNDFPKIGDKAEQLTLSSVLTFVEAQANTVRGEVIIIKVLQNGNKKVTKT